jgi:hypothetical protein
MAVKKHTVKFVAKKKVEVPVEVKFKTKDGKKVNFPGHKPVLKKVKVEFKAAGKKG